MIGMGGQDAQEYTLRVMKKEKKQSNLSSKERTLVDLVLGSKKPTTKEEKELAGCISNFRGPLDGLPLGN